MSRAVRAVTQPYTKPWLSIDEQIARIVSRGMSDAADHRSAFEQIGYYRLSGYWYPFRRLEADGSRLDDFYPEATFAHVLALYDFDSRLRGAIWHAVGTVELAVRARVAYVLGEVDPFVHLDRRLLDPTVPQYKFERFTADLEKLQAGSKEDFVAHFDEKYDGRLPVWSVTEIMQFGQLARLYEFSPYPARVAIAKAYGARADELGSWLRALNIVRNVTAHHGRLWNRGIAIGPQLKHRRADPLLAHAVGTAGRSYDTIAVLAYLLRALGRYDVRDGIRRVLDTFPEIPGVHLGMMRVPEGWATELLWKSRPDDGASADAS